MLKESEEMKKRALYTIIALGLTVLTVGIIFKI